LTSWQLLLTGIPFVILFYVNAYWLLPTWLARKKRLAYIVYVVVALLLTVVLSGLAAYIGAPPPPGAHAITFRRLFPGLFFLMAGTSLGVSRENARLERLRKEKETEHLRTELSFLRTQVNPHFMLNVLNSMALLARKKSDLLEPVLMELARLMNYMLYDTNREMIFLEDEIGYLRAYIDLQMLRFGSDVTVRFNTPASLNGRLIEPMLLIPLVENAFKHGIGLVNDPLILIDIAIENDERLVMTVKNKYSPLIRQREDKPSGIGLSNLTKRLELMYPGRFQLQRMDNLQVDTRDPQHWFIIHLNIPLQ
jgi:LytS/YehU family sensor histidine kinase